MKLPAVLLAVLLLAACKGGQPVKLAEATRACPAQYAQDEVRLPGGAFTLGAKPEHGDEGPERRVTVGPFSIDRT